MSIRHTASSHGCTSYHLSTLPFATQFFLPSMEDRHTVADETNEIYSATLTGWTSIRITFPSRHSLRLLTGIVQSLSLSTSYVDGIHQDSDFLQKVLTASGDAKSFTLPYPVHLQIKDAQRLKHFNMFNKLTPLWASISQPEHYCSRPIEKFGMIHSFCWSCRLFSCRLYTPKRLDFRLLQPSPSPRFLRQPMIYNLVRELLLIRFPTLTPLRRPF